MLNYHRSFKDALLSVLLKIPTEGETAVSYPIVLHEGRKAGGQQILVEFPALPNLVNEKRIRVWLEHSDTDQQAVDGLGRPGFPGGVNPPDDPPKPPKRDPKPDPETPKDPKKDPKQPEKPPTEDPPADESPKVQGPWEIVQNAGLALVTGAQAAVVEQYLPLPVDVKKYLRAVISVDKDAGDNTGGIVTVSLVY
jgi:outer membrane biosynthesis protein TonB